MATVSLLDVEAAVGRDLEDHEIVIAGRMVEQGATLTEVVEMVNSGLTAPEPDDGDLPVHRYEPRGDGAQEVP